MKFKSSYIAIMMALALFSCSDDNGIDSGKQEIVYNATLSMAVKNEVQAATKADGDAVAATDPGFIKKLSIVVFQEDKLVAHKDSTNAEKGVYAIEEVKVPAGVVKAFVFANLPNGTTALIDGTTTLADLKALKLDLSNETDGSLAMTSKEIDATLYVGYNYIGYKTTTGAVAVDLTAGIKVAGYELTGAVIPLYRYISRVQLTKVTLDPSENFRKNVSAASFKLEEMFFASVKGQSMQLAGDNATYPYEMANAALWSGDYATIGGTMKTSTTNVLKDIFRYDFTTNNTVSWSAANNNPGSLSGTDEVLGKSVYVYENSVTTDPTLLVLKGTYSYTIKDGATVTMPDRFYAVIVNDPANDGRTFTTGAVKHDYIQHNNIYKIAVTVAGSGSDTPYTPLATAAVNAKVTVEKWKVVNMDTPVD